MKNNYAFFKRFLIAILALGSLNLFSQSVATYDITFTSVWNANDHGTLPGNAHWSRLVGANHKTVNEFLAMGSQATQGVEDVAELGANTAFFNEVNASIAANNTQQLINMSSLSTATGSVTISDIEISEEFPLLTIISMIAPSPDWFIGINSYDLRPSGNWINSVTIDLFPYDAGTENGSTYSTDNSATVPQSTIESIVNVPPFNDQRVGYFTITLKSVLGTDDIASFNEVKVYPNPSNGIVSLTNVANLDLETLEFYDLIGNLVKVIDLKETTNHTFNIKDIKQGIYFASINTISGKTKTQKFIIR